MPTIQALKAEDTGLPWHTGSVHTAICPECNLHNIDMFRRCTVCGHLICNRRGCFQTKGFKHYCMGNPPNGAGPYPTLEEENRILAFFDAEAPSRDNDISEPPLHTVNHLRDPPKFATPVANNSSPAVAARTPIAQRMAVKNPPRIHSPRIRPARRAPKATAAAAAASAAQVLPAAPVPAHAVSVAPASEKRARSPSDSPSAGSSDKVHNSPPNTRSGRKSTRIDEAGNFTTATPSRPSVKTTIESGGRSKATTLANGTFTIDVRNINTLTVALAPGFHAADLGVPSQVYYQWKCKDDDVVRKEPVMQFADAADPDTNRFQLVTRTANGNNFNGRALSHDSVAEFQSAFMSTREVESIPATPSKVQSVTKAQAAALVIPPFKGSSSLKSLKTSAASLFPSPSQAEASRLAVLDEAVGNKVREEAHLAELKAQEEAYKAKVAAFKAKEEAGLSKIGGFMKRASPAMASGNKIRASTPDIPAGSPVATSPHGLSSPPSSAKETLPSPSTIKTTRPSRIRLVDENYDITDSEDQMPTTTPADAAKQWKTVLGRTAEKVEAPSASNSTEAKG